MFSVFDRAYSWYSNSGLSRLKESLPPRSEVRTDNSKRTIAIIPTAVLANNWLIRRIIPRIGTTYIHPVSALYHMTPNIDETLQRLEATYQEAARDVTNALSDGARLNVLAISLGTSLASRLAGEFPCEELTMIVPGDRLGECAIESRLTGPTVARAPSLEEYVKKLRIFDPIRYVQAIGRNTGRLRVYIAGRDLLIPGFRGRIIADALKRHHPQAELKSWEWADHHTGILLSALELAKK
jgi:hypothetical protein